MWFLGSNLIGEWKVCQAERWEGVHSVEVVGYNARSLITTSLPAASSIDLTQRRKAKPFSEVLWPLIAQEMTS